MRRELRSEIYSQTVEPFSHDSASRDDVRARHLFVTSAVCRIPTVDPHAFDPLLFPEDHKAPEDPPRRVWCGRPFHPGAPGGMRGSLRGRTVGSEAGTVDSHPSMRLGAYE
jgi:hypothetical protein